MLVKYEFICDELMCDHLQGDTPLYKGGHWGLSQGKSLLQQDSIGSSTA